MQLVDEKTIARGMVRAESGDDLLTSLETLAQTARWRDAYVTGTGMLELVELARAVGDVITLENAELVSLVGRIVREQDEVVVKLRASVLSGGRLESGQIVAAVTGDLLLVVDAVAAPVAPVQRPAPRAAAPARTPPPPPPPPSPPAPTGEAVRPATEPISYSFSTRPVVPRMAMPAPIPAEAENPAVEPGDFLDHPQLGRCEIVGDDEAGGTRIRVPSGRVRVLRLDALQVLPGEVDPDGHTIFKIAGPRIRR
ncbi:MAG TPA: PPC domain-containing DNA-binding protein [Polyangiaceae bacterium]|nr:PPC domain-containing DNA-binding protein [Polyangiaceae bacterium]